MRNESVSDEIYPYKNIQISGHINHSAGKRDRDPYPSSECLKVAVGGRELCISERAKRESGSLTITGFCYFTKTASATILNSNKTAKMAFFNHAKRYHRSVRFQPKCFCSASGLISTSVESFRFLQYQEVGFPEPLFLNSREIYDYYY